MKKKIKKNVVITGIIYWLFLLTGITITCLLVENMTLQLGLSIFFVALAYTVMFAIFIISMLDNRQNVIQNSAISTLGILYFVLTVVITICARLFRFTIKWFIIAELIVLVLGVTVILLGYLGKDHIENES